MLWLGYLLGVMGYHFAQEGKASADRAYFKKQSKDPYVYTDRHGFLRLKKNNRKVTRVRPSEGIIWYCSDTGIELQVKERNKYECDNDIRRRKAKDEGKTVYQYMDSVHEKFKHGEFFQDIKTNDIYIVATLYKYENEKWVGKQYNMCNVFYVDVNTGLPVRRTDECLEYIEKIKKKREEGDYRSLEEYRENRRKYFCGARDWVLPEELEEEDKCPDLSHYKNVGNISDRRFLSEMRVLTMKFFNGFDLDENFEEGE